MQRARHKSARALLFSLVVVLAMGGCRQTEETGTPEDFSERTIDVVATTSMIADLVRVVGGERVNVTGMMGPGVDPHLFKASAGDVQRMAEADVIFYNGIHLEGKMTDIFEQMRKHGIPTFAVAEDGINEAEFIESPNFQGNFDPHVWFDASLWLQVTRYVQNTLTELDPTHGHVYLRNASHYIDQMEELDIYIRQRADEVPQEKRVLVTAHDAFSYFGRAYGFEVYGLQGISTATEAGTADVQALADFIAERKIPAMFVESSVSPRSIEAVKEAVRARGFDVEIGGYLFSDALGNPGTPEGTYLGTVRHNIDTIVDALTGRAGA